MITRIIKIAIILSLAVLSWLPAGCGTMNQNNLPSGWQTIRPLDGILSMAVQGDTVWTGTKDDLYQVDRQTGKIIGRVKNAPEFTYVKALFADKNGLLYIGHFNGLTVYDGKTFQSYTLKDGLPDNRVNALLNASDGRIWIGTWGGACVFQEGKFTNVLKKADGLADDNVNVILEDRNGGMWFGSLVAPAGGLTYSKDNRFQIFSTANGLPHDDITSLFQDSEGNVWAGTGLLYRGGAAKFAADGNGWKIAQTLAKKDGLAGEKVRYIFQDRDGAMWFGSEYDGLAIFSKGKWKTINESRGLSGAEVTCILQEADGSFWIGTTKGITRLTYAAAQALQ